MSLGMRMASLGWDVWVACVIVFPVWMVIWPGVAVLRHGHSITSALMPESEVPSVTHLPAEVDEDEADRNSAALLYDSMVDDPTAVREHYEELLASEELRALSAEVGDALRDLYESMRDHAASIERDQVDLGQNY